MILVILFVAVLFAVGYFSSKRIKPLKHKDIENKNWL